ncbi:MAG: type VI secretion system protein TssA [Tepidisphaera sp.]
MGLDIESLLKPLSDADPCGEDLRYDRRALEILRMAEGKEGSVMGDQVIPGEEPDWRELKDGCLELLARGRDLRVSVALSLALLKLEGFAGFADGLALIRGLLERHWASVHPKLDPDDGNDPTERGNIIATFNAPLGTFGEKMRFAERIMAAPLCDSRQWGRYGLRDVRVASGQLDAGALDSGQSPPDVKVIERAFDDTDAETLAALERSTGEALKHAEGIDKAFEAGAGVDKSPELSGFITLLKDAHGQVRRQKERLAGGGGSATESPSGAAGGGAVSSAPGGGLRLDGELANREQVAQLFEKIYRYYERVEPSSPVPLLMKSCEKLVGKRFTDIVKVLTPDAVALLERLAADETPAG